ncbi:hypothetical protein IscW_ISCW010684 [Ixodes scapularis]|uniref:DUF4806 domain-containing protein n=1 Tax=Ixodes scapularis TaxID=6945 RepID=B7Q7J3_IXOSC|nr:hypothetical protein IscW_ISCW010684 [Ixodes scapularis]|eukprot:XP_002404083.1 hypothetical protein IscW_ISCW010684 [Ixodes scapularis]
MATVNGDAQLPAKKSTGHRLPVGGAFMFKPSARPHSQGAQPKNSDDAARDKRSIKSAKGSGAGNLVGAAADRPSPVHVQHPGSSNEPGTSAWPSGEQGVQDSESLLPPTPPLRADHANQLQYDADNGNHSDLILIDDSSDGDIEENPGAAKREAGDVNSWDAKEGGSFKKVHKDLDLLHEKVDVLHQKVDALEEKVHAAPPAASLAHPVLRKLPMKTAEEFEAVETLLADENSFKLMVSHLKSFDGSTLEEKADGMMTRLFSLELAATYNYNKGSKGKLVFKGTLAEKAVRRAAMESFPGLEPKEYTSHLRKRFRKAYDHLKKQEDARILREARALLGAVPGWVQDQA